MANVDVQSERDHAWARGIIGLADAPPVAPAHDFTGFDRVVQGVRVRGLILRGATSPTLPAYLLEPVAHSGGPRVLAIHQHNNEYDIGKGEVAGLHGDRDMAYGLELAQRGCTVLAADVSGFEDRAPADGDPHLAEQRLAWNLVAQGTSIGALHLGDLRELVSWLLEQSSTSPSLGVVGHSMGGTLALFLTAVDERVNATVSSCGVGTLASFDDANVLHNPSWYIPGLRAVGDTPALASVLDEQRIYLASADNDYYCPVDGIREFVAGFRPGRAALHLYHGEHSFPESERVPALDWLVSELTP